METHRNLEVIRLLRQLRPDFKTITDFRGAFRAVFRQFARLCRERDLYGRELIALDGTHIKVLINMDRSFTRAKLKADLHLIDERLGRYLDEMKSASKASSMPYISLMSDARSHADRWSVGSTLRLCTISSRTSRGCSGLTARYSGLGSNACRRAATAPTIAFSFSAGSAAP